MGAPIARDMAVPGLPRIGGRHHQDFPTFNPGHPYTVINDLPKVGNLKQIFSDLCRADPALVMATPRSN